MKFDYSYFGESSVTHSAGKSDLSFSPDTTRQPTFFRGQLSQHLAFREAVSALHDIVVSDMRLEVKERADYKAWAEEQELNDLQAITQQKASLQADVEAKRQELAILDKNYHSRMQPFWTAQQKYFNYLRKHDMKAWYILDPVITVHPDSLFLECFSKDESSYGCLSMNYNALKPDETPAYGTTNIDYSEGLYNEFQKIRTYKETRFDIDPTGFEVQTQREESFREVKIDLPDSWVRGFLQVSSAMNLDMTSFQLSPVDVQNICFILRRKKEVFGPRSLRFKLTPGQPVKIIFEPWNEELICKRSIFKGSKEEEIRVWGRRRLHILERLLPVAKSFTVHLSGSGMPSFYVADLGDFTFTLGLSGWSANNWSQAANFELMAPRGETTEDSIEKVSKFLSAQYYSTAEMMSEKLDLSGETVKSSLSLLIQSGKVVYDLKGQVYRWRELSREELHLASLRFENEREQKAEAFVMGSAVKLASVQENEESLLLNGTVRDQNKAYQTELILDADRAIKSASCSCNFYLQNKLYKGPCEHMLALKKGYNKKKTI